MEQRDRNQKQRPLVPEHDMRNCNEDSGNGNSLHPDVVSAYAYVDSVIDTSDFIDPPSWHGWALREAFLAGMSAARKSS